MGGQRNVAPGIEDDNVGLLVFAFNKSDWSLTISIPMENSNETNETQMMSNELDLHIEEVHSTFIIVRHK